MTHKNAKDIKPGDVVIWRDGSQHVIQSVEVNARGLLDIEAGESVELGVAWYNLSPDAKIQTIS